MGTKLTEKNGRLSGPHNISDTNLLLTITICVFIAMYIVAVIVLGGGLGGAGTR